MTQEPVSSLRSHAKGEQRLYFHSIVGSIAHADMLAAKGTITHDEADLMADGLIAINNDLDAGKLQVEESAPNVDAFLEQELVARIGETGRLVERGRTAAGQASLNLRLFLRDECDAIRGLLVELTTAVTAQAEKCRDLLAPGGKERLGHHLLAYAFMFKRDYERLGDASKRMNLCPIGPMEGINCDMVAASLGFEGIAMNSADAESDRDFCVEILACFALVLTHLSRLGEELTSWPGKGDTETARSFRAKAGQVDGALTELLALLRGLPLGCTEELRDASPAVIQALETVRACLEAAGPLVAGLSADKDLCPPAGPEGAEWMARELEYVQGWLTGIRASLAQRQRDMAQQMAGE